MNKITWKQKAAKQLRRLPPKIQSQITKSVRGLEDFSSNPNIKRLVNHKYDYRLTSGRYRVLFDYDGVVRIVSIEEVKKRDSKTY